MHGAYIQNLLLTDLGDIVSLLLMLILNLFNYKSESYTQNHVLFLCFRARTYDFGCENFYQTSKCYIYIIQYKIGMHNNTILTM